MNKTPAIEPILARYGLENSACEFLAGAGGFSGAQFWKIQQDDEQFVLRRWPKQHPTRERLEWLHLVLLHTKTNGLGFVAVPMRKTESTDNSTFHHTDDHFWELTRWMPGRADFHDDPNDERLSAAMIALARFHKSTAQVNLGFDKSASAQDRLTQLNNLSPKLEALKLCDDFSFGNVIFRLHQMVMLPEFRRWSQQVSLSLAPLVQQVFPVQPVIRDVWHDHVLFTGNEVTGLVDFGAMRIDSIACDLSRLLGSLLGSSDERWEFAINEYSKERPVSVAEQSLLPLLDQSGIILGAINWLNWILIDGRIFESKDDVERRIQSLIQRISDCFV